MNLVVFGAGYVGLVTATGLAELGHSVVCVDTDPARVSALRAGEIPIFEPGLAELVTRNVREGRIGFETAVPAVARTADAWFIAVGTPPSKDGSADISAVLSVAETIASLAERRALVVVKSTVPVGTGDRVQALLDGGSRLGLEHVSNPEFLREGTALEDFFQPERIVCGVRTPWAEERMRALYTPLQLEASQVQITSVRSAELCKYAANALLALRISFMNEMARLCDALGADVRDVRRALGSDSRIGPRYLYPGPGYGGSCFPKDVQALAHFGRDAGVTLLTVEATHETNERQRGWVVDKVLRALGSKPEGKRVAVWGLAFKPETDDVRESPALAVVTKLLAAGVEVRVHDPEATDNFLRALQASVGAAAEKVVRCARALDAVDDADALLLLTEWRSYRAPDFPAIGARMRTRTIVDARNVWGAAGVSALGFAYHSLGLGPRAGDPSP